MTTNTTVAPPGDNAPLKDGLSLRGVTKRFGTLTANDHIDLDIVPGRIHCLLGENGAGKSTLMNILYGLLPSDEGQVYIDGVEQHFDNSKQAMAAGIGMVHQHFMLVNVFTVAENIALGREESTAGILSMRRARAKVRELSDRYHFDVNPDSVIENLPVGVQQRVEILKSLANDAQYLIFDEPTAVLTPQEIDELMAVMKTLRDEGRAIVFITHKLREVRAIADDITVVRRGRIVGKASADQSEAELAEMMVGRAVKLVVDKDEAKPWLTTAAQSLSTACHCPLRGVRFSASPECRVMVRRNSLPPCLDSLSRRRERSALMARTPRARPPPRLLRPDSDSCLRIVSGTVLLASSPSLRTSC